MEALCRLPPVRVPQELDENVEYKEREDEFDIVVNRWDPERRKGRAEAERDGEDELPVTIDAMDNVRSIFIVYVYVVVVVVIYAFAAVVPSGGR